MIRNLSGDIIRSLQIPWIIGYCIVAALVVRSRRRGVRDPARAFVSYYYSSRSRTLPYRTGTVSYGWITEVLQLVSSGYSHFIYRQSKCLPGEIKDGVDNSDIRECAPGDAGLEECEPLKASRQFAKLGDGDSGFQETFTTCLICGAVHHHRIVWGDIASLYFFALFDIEVFSTSLLDARVILFASERA